MTLIHLNIQRLYNEGEYYQEGYDGYQAGYQEGYQNYVGYDEGGNYQEGHVEASQTYMQVLIYPKVRKPITTVTILKQNLIYRA